MITDPNYKAKASYQLMLDEMFPRGAEFHLVELNDDDTEELSGLEFVTGRVFCSEARFDEDGWEYRLFFDPRWTEEEYQEYVPPYQAWTTQIDDTDEDDIWEIPVIVDPDVTERRDLIRLRTDHKLHPGQREFVTELREQELFPYGLEVEDVEADTG